KIRWNILLRTYREPIVCREEKYKRRTPGGGYTSNVGPKVRGARITCLTTLIIMTRVLWRLSRLSVRHRPTPSPPFPLLRQRCARVGPHLLRRPLLSSNFPRPRAGASRFSLPLR